jgi:hypothetical protein
MEVTQKCISCRRVKKAEEYRLRPNGKDLFKTCIHCCNLKNMARKLKKHTDRRVWVELKPEGDKAYIDYYTDCNTTDIESSDSE